MREELRAALLKCYLLKLRQARGDEPARMLVLNAGVDPAVVDQETAWVSVDAAHRVISAISEELNAEEMRDAARFVGHPDALGPWVRMVREAREPIDAYRYLVSHAPEQTRVGEYELEAGDAVPPPARVTRDTDRTLPPPPVPIPNEGPAPVTGAPDEAPPPPRPVHKVTIIYRPRAEEGAVETDELLCGMRVSQLAGLPTLWGLPPATIVQESCVAKGGAVCKYVVSWHGVGLGTGRPALIAMATAVGAFIVVAPFGKWLAGLLAALLAGALGYAIGMSLDRAKKLERERAFERTRIAALERGLELRGDSTVQAPGELVGIVLGGKYRVGKRIGSGGIGVVHAAEHVALGTQVAVKVLRGAAAKDGSEIARLRREAQVASALDHPNVVKVLDLDQMQDGSIFIVMELLRGRSLAERLHRDGPLAPAFAIQVFRQVCLALGAAHDIGVVHRDLKPGNVFLCEDGVTAKVLDFGMSKLASVGGNEKLTQDGYTLGTPEYMAPEQCIGAAVEARTDIYELGVLIYEAVTGDLPIKSANRRELLDLHQRQVPPPMRQRRPDLPIPPELDAAVAQCLRKRISERPDSARTLERMLAAIPLDGVPMSYGRNVGRHPGARRMGVEDPRPTEKAPSARQQG